MSIIEILLILLCCLLQCVVCIAFDSTAMTMKKVANLSPRFQRILSLLPWQPISNAYKVADIGCDHGLLSVKMSTLHHVAHIYATDVSEKAASGARDTLATIPDKNKSKIDLLVGDGLQPLLDKEVCDVDTLILSGMGVRSLFEILCTPTDNQKDSDERDVDDAESKSSDYWQTRNYEIDTPTLDRMGVRRIIVQPWPPNFLPLQAFYSAVLYPTMAASPRQSISASSTLTGKEIDDDDDDHDYKGSGERISEGRACTGEPSIDPSKALALDPDSEWANEVMGHYEAAADDTMMECGENGDEGGRESVEMSQWRFEAQHVNYLGGYHYITSSFVRNRSGEGSCTDESDEESGTFHLKSNPLFQRYATTVAGSDEEGEREQWREYLENQIVSLERKQLGLRRQQGQERAEPRRGRPLDYSVDACLSLLKGHIE